MRPVSNYSFDKKIYKYILQKKHVDIIITQELHKLHMLNADNMHLTNLKDTTYVPKRDKNHIFKYNY